MSFPIRILHVFGKLNRNGAETMVMNLYREVDRSKIQFDFVVHTHEKCDFDEEILSLGGRIHRVEKYKGINHFKYCRQWRQIIENGQYAIIHGHVRSTASIYLPIAKKYNVITISHSHSISSGNGIRGMIKNALQFPVRYQADYFMACSDEAGVWMFGNKIVRSEKYYKIHNAIHLQKFIYNPNARAQVRAELDVENHFVVGHVGRFESEKNHLKLINIFNALQKKYPESKLLLLGEGGEMVKIKEMVETFGIEDKVIFAGNKDNVNDYYHAMDIFLFPSLYEGLGMAVIEAQSSGLECIVSEKIPEEAHITESVHYLNNRDPDELWVEKILSINSNRRVNNYKSIKAAGYDIEDTRTAIIDIYTEIVK